MGSIIYKVDNIQPLLITQRLSKKAGFIFLFSAMMGHPCSRYSFICVDPFLTFRSFDSICEISTPTGISYVFGNPWEVINSLIRRFEIKDNCEPPFPLGGAFGYFGYDLKNFLEAKVATNAIKDIPLPDCCLNFYDSFIVIDHEYNRTFIVSTGIKGDGSRNEELAELRVEQLREVIHQSDIGSDVYSVNHHGLYEEFLEFDEEVKRKLFIDELDFIPQKIYSNLSKEQFIGIVERAKKYIFQGDIYQVNLSQRFETQSCGVHPYTLFENLVITSPSPFAAYMNFDDFQVVSSSPELFLKMDEDWIVTRPIKGTRPRLSDHDCDRQMLFELQTSEKERAELVMITDLLRNDLGRICEFGSVKTTEMLKVERHPTVYHMVSTIEGRIKQGIGHLESLSACFPGGSITGAPKIRAMQIIDELEPTARGIYTGAHGYIGFNRRSQLSITIRTAVCAKDRIWYQTGAGIVADSDPEQEYEETIAKAVAFFQSLNMQKNKDVAVRV